MSENAGKEHETVTEQWHRLADEIAEYHDGGPPKNSRQRQLMYKQDDVSELLREIRDGWADERER